jgi:hypothetical protein
VVTSGLGAMTGRRGVPLTVPLPFLLAGVGAAGLFGLALPWLAPLALESPLAPRVLALVHLATLGWLTMTVLGASLQLTPVILVTPLGAARWLRWQFPVYLVGVVLLLAGFWSGWLWPLALGGSLIVLAVAHHIVVLAATLARATTRPLTARFLVAALGYLGVVVALGLTAALNLHLGFLGAGITQLLPAHILLGVVGWLTNMLIGVSYTLVRMFALAHGHSDRLGARIFWLLQGGVLVTAAGFALSWGAVVALGLVGLVAAVALFAWDYRGMLRMRRRKVLEVTQWHGIAAVAYLVVLVPAGALMTLFGGGQPRLLVALGLVALVGWLGQSTIGYLYKIVPFLIWHERYGPLVGRQKVPLMRELVRERWSRASFWLINVGLPVAALGAALGVTEALRVGAGALGIGLALAAVNVVGVVRR